MKYQYYSSRKVFAYSAACLNSQMQILLVEQGEQKS